MITLDMPSKYYSRDNAGMPLVNKPLKIAVHSMGQFIDDEARDYFAPNWLEHLGVSSHMMLAPDGIAIRCVPDDKVAWHAKGHNTGCLGIEFLVPGLHTYATFLETIKNPWLSDAQFSTGQQIIKRWMEKYSINKENIFYHSELSPGRKLDPGEGFPSSFRDTL